MVSDYAGHIYVRLYAKRIGKPLCDLSEDYGMGMVGMFLQIGVFFLAAIGTFALLSYKARKKAIHERA
jgi:hypothetical protein